MPHMLQMLVVHVNAAFALVRRYGTVVRFIVQISADQQIHLLDKLFVRGDIAALQRFFQGLRLFLRASARICRKQPHDMLFHVSEAAFHQLGTGVLHDGVFHFHAHVVQNGFRLKRCFTVGQHLLGPMTSAAEVERQVLAAVIHICIVIRHPMRQAPAPQRIDGVLAAVAAEADIPADEDPAADVYPGGEVRPVRLAIRPQRKRIACIRIADPPVVACDAFVIAACVYACLVVVRAVTLAHQDAHGLRHVHRQAVKAAVRGQRQRVRRVFLRPFFRVFHTLGDGIRMALSAVHEVVVQKRLFYIFRHVRFALTGLSAPVDHAVQVALFQSLLFPVQCRHAQLHAGVFHAHVPDELCVKLAQRLSRLAAVEHPLVYDILPKPDFLTFRIRVAVQRTLYGQRLHFLQRCFLRSAQRQAMLLVVFELDVV